MKPSRELALEHIAALTGDPNTPVRFRFIHDSDRSRAAIVRHGRVTDLWSEIEAVQREGFGIFFCPNEGGDTDAEITRIRACFVDGDNIALPERWHLEPDLIVQRGPRHWHGYWLTPDLPVEDFQKVQRQLAAHYGSDKTISNPSRVMRLAGTLHLKAAA